MPLDFYYEDPQDLFQDELLVVKCFDSTDASDTIVSDSSSIEESSFHQDDSSYKTKVIEPSSLGVLGALGLIHNAGTFLVCNDNAKSTIKKTKHVAIVCILY